MTIKECIDIVDNAKPNQYSVGDKVAWLSFIDEIIINDVLKTHEGYDKRYDDFKGYTEDKLSVPLIVKNPYDRLYVAYLKMMIDKENGETARYNNSATTYNTYLLEFKKYYNKTHLPLSNVRIPTKKATGASDKDISEAQLESLKNVVYALLRDDLDDIISDDKLYDIVMKYVLNNADMLKGKDGKDGADGKDGVTGKSLTYKDLTEAEKADFLKDVYTRYFIDNSIKALEDKIEDGKTIAKEDLERFRQSIYTDLESKASVKFVRDTLETKADKEFVDDEVYTKDETNKQVKSASRYTYYTPSTGLEIVDGVVIGIGSCRDEHIVIPELYNDCGVKKPVTAVRTGTFGGLLGSDGGFIKSITFPSSVELFDMSGSYDNIINSDYCPNLAEIYMMNPNITWDDISYPFRLLENAKDLYFAFTEKQYDNMNSGKRYTLITLKNENIAAGIVPTKHFGNFVTSAVIGNIDAALDELHGYATSLMGGEA